MYFFTEKKIHSINQFCNLIFKFFAWDYALKVLLQIYVHTVFFLALDDLDWGFWDFESSFDVIPEDVLALSRPRSGKSCSTFNGTCLSLALFNLLKVDHSGGWGFSRVVKVGIMLSPVSSNLIGTILEDKFSALTSVFSLAVVQLAPDVGGGLLVVDFWGWPDELCCPLKQLMKCKQIVAQLMQRWTKNSWNKISNNFFYIFPFQKMIKIYRGHS